VNASAGSRSISKARLETLADGIFAIAMTLLILEIRVPELEDRRSTQEMLSHLLHLVPGLVSYLISFSMLGIFWYRHHRMLHALRRVDLAQFAFNLVFLFGATLFPFCAAVLGRYPTNPLSPTIYAAPVLVLATGLALQWEWAERHGHLAEDATAAELRSLKSRSRFAPFFVGSMLCLLAGRLTPWGYAPLLILVPSLLWLRVSRGRESSEPHSTK